jgi:hypothetical protein
MKMPQHIVCCCAAAGYQGGTQVLPHLLYSPDLTPCSFLLFLGVKYWLKDCHFKEAAEMQVASKIVLQKVACDGFQKYLKQLYKA